MNGIKQESDAHSNAMTDNMSTASTAGQLMDPIDSLLDLSEYDNTNAANQFSSPALSPSTNKNSFVRPTAASTPASMLSTSQQMTAPSHQYDQYKQQTGFVPGALANTFAVTQNSNPPLDGYSGYEMNGFLGNGSHAASEVFDFNTAPQASVSPSDIDLEFESPAPDSFFLEQMNTGAPAVPMGAPVVPSDDGRTSLQSPPGLIANGVPQGRLWPGMHQQAAIAKAQAQQRQQQQIIQQQQQQQQHQRRQSQVRPMAQPVVPQTQRAKAGQPSDPIVEQKITQLLSSMRAKSSSPHGSGSNGMSGISRPKKDEDDMDDDERLLASEEGKKLSSKERRQLRNKVSARAFRSRRKEYISQLEAEIAGKVTENGELRTQNRALVEENKRLSDLTRMLLGSPSFSDFLDRLSANPALVPQTQTQAQTAPPAPRALERQSAKDPNPNNAQHQIGMAMIPEQNIDFSMLQMETEPVYFQPQVYAVIETPDVGVPCIDTSILSGKTSNFVGRFDDEEKVEMPVIKHPVLSEAVEALKPAVVAKTVDAEFDSDPEFALYHDAAPSSYAAALAEDAAPTVSKSVETDAAGHAASEMAIFSGIATEKALARYELTDVEATASHEVDEAAALVRIAQIGNALAATAARLDMLNAEQ